MTIYDGVIYLVDIYDKAEYSTVDVAKVRKMVQEI